jgi:hypothetical protein
MKQDAIVLTSTNVSEIVTQLFEYTDTQEFLQDYGHMMLAHSDVVLTRDVLDNGTAMVSYVVTRQMFDRNNPDIAINDKTFTYVRTV